MSEPPVWEQLFHQAALLAYCEVGAECGGVPESEAVRRRAYAIYEAELAKRRGS